MVKKAKWLKNVKKAFSPDSKKLKHESVECQDSVISYPVLIATSRSSSPQFEVRVDEVNYEQKKNLYPPSSDSVTATVAHVLVDSPPSSPESVHQAIVVNRFAGKSKEEAAAILIQSTFRGHLARRESQVMRGQERLKLLMEGSVVQRQAAITLKCMQTLSRVQSQIRSRRIRMSEENQARHKQLLQKHAKELGGLKLFMRLFKFIVVSSDNGGNWNYSNQSKEQVEAGMLHKYEATMRRERALAYAFTHQQNLKSFSKTANPMFMDPSNPTWGWSWLERWMAGRPWESSEKEQNTTNNDNSSVKNSTNRNSQGGETAKSSNRNKLNSSTKPNTPSASSTATRNPRKKRPIPSSIKSKSSDDEAKSSERNRRPSIARPSVSDDETLSSSTARRSSNLIPTTKSARGKPKSQTSSRVAVTTSTTEESSILPEKAPAKKRLSTSASPAPKPRRSSAPPKVEKGVLKAERTP
ncbi:IQ-domain 1 [Arabidopsis thaliana]|uniref:IQ-domain 1 n=1 Tax=Arabidopsis thaliana TaxID=3702 RepID=F4J1A4_ARATH|nr:IQ-domain 1 [Arabidopsis thaliana]AEE74802.1 IQ-domain 1 [Arabidopsis thaliana]|eukprot:NP_001189848.1 IQ-domain 1 [Arabidopsis thaliana]